MFVLTTEIYNTNYSDVNVDNLIFLVVREQNHGENNDTLKYLYINKNNEKLTSIYNNKIFYKRNKGITVNDVKELEKKYNKDILYDWKRIGDMFQLEFARIMNEKITPNEKKYFVLTDDKGIGYMCLKFKYSYVILNVNYKLPNGAYPNFLIIKGVIEKPPDQCRANTALKLKVMPYTNNKGKAPIVEKKNSQQNSQMQNNKENTNENSQQNRQMKNNKENTNENSQQNSQQNSQMRNSNDNTKENSRQNNQIQNQIQNQNIQLPLTNVKNNLSLRLPIEKSKSILSKRPRNQNINTENKNNRVRILSLKLNNLFKQLKDDETTSINVKYQSVIQSNIKRIIKSIRELEGPGSKTAHAYLDKFSKFFEKNTQQNTASSKKPRTN